MSRLHLVPPSPVRYRDGLTISPKLCGLEDACKRYENGVPHHSKMQPLDSTEQVWDQARILQIVQSLIINAMYETLESAKEMSHWPPGLLSMQARFRELLEETVKYDAHALVIGGTLTGTSQYTQFISFVNRKSGNRKERFRVSEVRVPLDRKAELIPIEVNFLAVETEYYEMQDFYGSILSTVELMRM